MSRYRYREARDRARESKPLATSAKAKRAVLRLRFAQVALRKLWLFVSKDLGSMDRRTRIVYDIWYGIMTLENTLKDLLRDIDG